MAELRGAVIGYGLAGSVFHAPLIAATPGLKVSTVVTGNPERQVAARRAHPNSIVASHAEEVFGRAAAHDFVWWRPPTTPTPPWRAKRSTPGCRWLSTSPLPRLPTRPGRWWSTRRTSVSR